MDFYVKYHGPLGGGGGGGSALKVIGSRSSPISITAAGGISITGNSAITKIYVVGSGGPVIVTANPRISAGSSDGQMLIIQGRSDTNTVRLNDGNGLVLNGPCILTADLILSLSWDGTNWVEISRQN